METESRRKALLAGARLLAVTALGAMAAALGLRRPSAPRAGPGYCDRAGRCGGCEVTSGCDAWQATHGGPRP